MSKTWKDSPEQRRMARELARAEVAQAILTGKINTARGSGGRLLAKTGTMSRRVAINLTTLENLAYERLRG